MIVAQSKLSIRKYFYQCMELSKEVIVAKDLKLYVNKGGYILYSPIDFRVKKDQANISSE